MRPTSVPTEGRGTAPIAWLGFCVLTIGVLLVGARIVGEPEAPPVTGDDGGGGGYQPIPLLPNTPITELPGGSPVPDGGPSVTIIQDVRETLERLPLDRNNPKGWTNPNHRAPKKPERFTPPKIRTVPRPRGGGGG